MELITDEIRNGPLLPLLQYWKCSACHNLLEDAMTIQPCEHNFCRSCCPEFTDPVNHCPECDFQFNSNDVKEL